MWWSWILTIVGVTGLYLAGKKVWWAWLIGLGAQVLWIAYATATQQWGFYVSALAYGWVYTRNALRWYREHQAVEPEQPEPKQWWQAPNVFPSASMRSEYGSGDASLSIHVDVKRATPEQQDAMRNLIYWPFLGGRAGEDG